MYTFCSCTTYEFVNEKLNVCFVEVKIVYYTSEDSITIVHKSKLTFFFGFVTNHGTSFVSNDTWGFEVWFKCKYSL